MIRAVMVRYLIDGLPVGKIADGLSTDRSSVRRHLKDGGITIRPVSGRYLHGRDGVCSAVKRAGYASFHSFARVRGLDPITEQATALGVSKSSLDRVYTSYRRLLNSLEAAGMRLPTSQFDGDDFEQRREG